MMNTVGVFNSRAWISALIAAVISFASLTSFAQVKCSAVFKPRTVYDQYTLVNDFDVSHSKEALRISLNGANPYIPDVIRARFGSTDALAGFKRLISSRAGALLLVEMLVRLQIIKNDVNDPYFSDLFLVAVNTPTKTKTGWKDHPLYYRSLDYLSVLKALFKSTLHGRFSRSTEDDDNPLEKSSLSDRETTKMVIQAAIYYREHEIRKTLKKTLKKKYDEDSDIELRALSEEDRAEFLFRKMIEILSGVKAEDKNSIDNLIAAFTEVEEVFRAVQNGWLSPEKEFQTYERIVAKLVRPAQVINKEYMGPPGAILNLLSNIIPGKIVETLEKLLRWLINFDREARRQVIVIGDKSEKRDLEDFVLVDKSIRLQYIEKDLLELKPKAKALLETYLVNGSNLFSKEFKDSLAEAYPELRTIFTKEKILSKDQQSEYLFVSRGPYGPGTWKGYHLTHRAALFLGMLRGDSSLFSKLTAQEFQTVRQEIITNMGLHDNENPMKLSLKKVDAFVAFLMLDALGTGHSLQLENLAKEHANIQAAQNEPTRRVIEIIKTFSPASRSFTRLEPDLQESLIRWLRYLYYFNAEQVVQMESSKLAYVPLQGIVRQDAAALYYRYLIDHAALPSKKNSIHDISSLKANTLELEHFKTFSEFKETLFAFSDGKLNTQTAYQNAFRLKSQQLGWEFKSDELHLLKLAGLMRLKTKEYADIMKNSFMEISPFAQQILKDLPHKPVLLEYASRLYSDFYYSHKGSDVGSRMKIYMELLAKILDKVEEGSNFASAAEEVETAQGLPNAKRQQKSELRLNLYNLLEPARTLSENDLLKLNFKFDVVGKTYHLQVTSSQAPSEQSTFDSQSEK